MHNLETEDCLLQILLSSVILSKFRYFNDKLSSEPLSFNDV